MASELEEQHSEARDVTAIAAHSAGCTRILGELWGSGVSTGNDPTTNNQYERTESHTTEKVL